VPQRADSASAAEDRTLNTWIISIEEPTLSQSASKFTNQRERDGRQETEDKAIQSVSKGFDFDNNLHEEASQRKHKG